MLARSELGSSKYKARTMTTGPPTQRFQRSHTVDYQIPQQIDEMLTLDSDLTTDRSLDDSELIFVIINHLYYSDFYQYIPICFLNLCCFVKLPICNCYLICFSAFGTNGDNDDNKRKTGNNIFFLIILVTNLSQWGANTMTSAGGIRVVFLIKALKL